MFAEKKELTRKKKQLMHLSDRFDRGDIIPHEQLEAVIGVKPNEGPWQYLVSRMRWHLQRTRGIVTLPEKTVGYRLLTVEQTYTEYPIYRFKRMYRQGGRLIRGLRETLKQNHPERERVRLMHELRNAITLQQAQRAQLTTCLGRPPQVVPRIRRPIPAPQEQVRALAM